MPLEPFGLTALTDVNDRQDRVGNLINGAAAFLRAGATQRTLLACPGGAMVTTAPGLRDGGSA